MSRSGRPELADREPPGQPPISLSAIIKERPAEEPVPGFLAQVAGRLVIVLAVLERTAVVAPPGPVSPAPSDRRLVPLDRLLCRPDEVRWRPRPAGDLYAAQRLRRFGKAVRHG